MKWYWDDDVLEEVPLTAWDLPPVWNELLALALEEWLDEH